VISFFPTVTRQICFEQEANDLITFQQVAPDNEMLALQHELDRGLRSLSFQSGIPGHGAHPPINIFADGEAMVIIAELPGMNP
jgi:HSP20 family molecular chaperone IbpA